MHAHAVDDVEPSLDDIEFLARSTHRVGVLTELAQRPRDRSHLRTVTQASAPTMSRILSDFQDRCWVDRDGPTYELTPLGAFVTERFMELCAAMGTERKLRDVWRWLPREMAGFSVDLFADAVVSYPGPGYPYEPVERVTQLIEGASRLRGFGTLELKSANIETVCGAVLDGTEMEYVFSPEVLKSTFAWNPERIMEVTACDHCTVFVHDSLPDEDRCGLSIVDDRIAICCHDPHTGVLEAVIDTDAPAAREWATALFEQHLREATPVDSTTVGSVLPSDLTA